MYFYPITSTSTRPPLSTLRRRTRTSCPSLSRAAAPLDASRVSITGHSRNGKQSLVAAAFDERITDVVGSSSGTPVAAPIRFSSPDFDEETTNYDTTKRDWFLESLKGYFGREDEVPADGHFILAMIGEEWGFFGILLVVGVYSALVLIGFRIASRAPDLFGELLAIGCTSLVAVQATLHMAVGLALAPATGLALPLISYGRSNLIVTLITLGILISVARAAPGGKAARA